MKINLFRSYNDFELEKKRLRIESIKAKNETLKLRIELYKMMKDEGCYSVKGRSEQLAELTKEVIMNDSRADLLM